MRKVASDGADLARRRLSDRLRPDEAYGPLLALLATTYELDAEFFETDFLPTVLGLGAWDDRGFASYVAMQRALASMDVATVLMEANRYRGRPRSLRVEVLPVAGERLQHAKVLLLVHEHRVRLLVSSANLTPNGYRRNREVALMLEASADDVQQAALIASALQQMPQVFEGRDWSAGASPAIALANERLAEWGAVNSATAPTVQSWFAWGGGPTPLNVQFVERWPSGARVDRITLVSPFWSDDRGKGPVSRFVAQLRALRVADEKTELRLLTDGVADSSGAYRPLLPEGYGGLSKSQLGLQATAQAVDPAVLPAEVGDRKDFTGTRPLHAKVALLQGPSHVLAYLGSANFTHHGWGYANPWCANIEAGMVLRAPTADAAPFVEALIPPATGDAVLLGDVPPGALQQLPPAEDDVPWPDFLHDVRLSPVATDDSQLELTVTVDPDRIEAEWSLVRVDGEVLHGWAPSPKSVLHVALSPGHLRQLLVQQEVAVRWWATSAAVRVPLNVDAAARDGLPIAPGEGPCEATLIAYYQGKIHYADMFSPPSPPSEPPKTPISRAIQAGVDTSRIQSYQVREFVRALDGIHDDLDGAWVSDAAAKHALWGPVSPVALAREVLGAARRGERSAMAAGFQLVEIMAAVRRAGAFKVPQGRRLSWATGLQQTDAKLMHFVAQLLSLHPDLPSSEFAGYCATILDVEISAIVSAPAAPEPSPPSGVAP